MSKSQAVTLVFALFFTVSQAQPFVLRGDEYFAPTESVALVWPCEKGKSDFFLARKKWAEGVFLPFSKLEKKGKFDRGRFDYWIILEVENATRDTFPLFINATRLDNDSIWHFSKNRPVSVQIPSKYGKKTPWPYFQKAIFDFAGNVAPGARDTIFIKFYNFKPAEDFLPTIHDARFFAAHFYHERIRQNLFFLIAFGAAVTIFVYAVAMWRGTRDVAYGWYAGYCAALGWTAFWNFEDYSFTTDFLTSWTNWDDFKLLINTGVLGICYSQFLGHFFQKQQPIYPKLANVITVILLVAMAVDVVLRPVDEHAAWLLYHFLRFGLTVVAFGSVIFIWREKGRPSRLITWGILSLATFEIASNFVPSDYVSLVATFGVMLDLFFFTLALAARSKTQIDEQARLAFEVEKMGFANQLELQNVRLRAAQDIHDEIGNRLAKLSLAAQVAARQPDLDQKALQSRLFEIEKGAQAAASDLREIVFSINPDFDLFHEMQAYFLEQASAFWAASSVDLHVDFEKSDLPTVVAPDAKRQLLLLFKEAQTNAAKHADAQNVWLTFKKTSEKGFVLEIRDDGRGFVLDEKKAFSNGLRGMKRRAQSLGASFLVSCSVGKGTTIRVEGCF